MRAIEIVRDLDDHTASRFFTFCCREVARRANGEAVLAGVPVDVRAGEHYREISALSAPQRAERLGRKHSIKVARVLLEYMASQDSLAIVIEDAWHAFQKDELAIDPSLERGFAGSMVTFAASSGFGGLARGSETTSLSPKLAETLAEAVLSEDAAASLAGRGVDGDRLQFTAFHLSQMRPDTWYDLLAYMHLEDAIDAVEEDRRSRKAASHSKQTRGAPTVSVARGTEITVVPRLPGCLFNPRQVTFRWLEDWHRADFRVCASSNEPGFELELPSKGAVAFYADGILLAEAPIWSLISEEAGDPAATPAAPEESKAAAYLAVFPSYSHDDEKVVARIAKAVLSLGFGYLRDVTTLKSGQIWKQELLERIEEASVFQLFWSQKSKASRYVRMEWEHALSLDRVQFIRPVFWEEPMPERPDELSALHFAQIDLT